MRIPFRIKFFCVLLAFSLGPIMVSRLVMMRASAEKARDVSGQVRSELLSIVSAELEQNAVGLLNMLEGRGQAMTLAARLLAKQAEYFLEGDEPTMKTLPRFTLELPDSVLAEGYVKRTMSGNLRSVRVGFGQVVFHLPPGARNDKATGQINRLQEMLPTFKEVYGEVKGPAYWLHVGLESGVFVTYPGHGNLPMMYDSRSQDWYKRTKQADACTWSLPVVDPATRLSMATVGCPVRNDKGEFAGVASIEGPISSILQEADLKSRWRGEIRSFVVVRTPEEDSAREGLLILGQRAYDEAGHHHWRTDIERDWLVSDDSEAFQELLRVMTEKKSGVMHLPYKGRDSVWAFASNPDVSFMLVAPETVISQLPNEVVGSMDGLFDNMRNISAIISGVMLIITGLIAWFGSRTITRPLISMAAAAKRLADGDFSVRMNMRTGDERDVYIDSFNEMGPKLEEHLRLSRDLELAKEVQNLLLPRTEPELAGYDISGGISYCDQTGGDYYDFIKVNCESGCSLGVVLGDVSGHGVPAALVMATARGQLHSLSGMVMTPEVRIGTINRFLSNDLDGTGRFLTMFYLQLDEGSEKVSWVRAGHDPAVHYAPETGVFNELGGDGLALGVLAEFKFQSYEGNLESGDIVTIATDGVWEARDASGEMFGKKRMLAIIRDSAHKNAEGIRKAIMDGVSEYQGNGQEDDIALVVIKKT